MAYTDDFAIAGVSKFTVRTIISNLNITILSTHPDGDKDISDSDVPKLRTAIKIVQKDQTLLENVPKLRTAIKIVQKDKTFLELENVPKLRTAIKIVQKDETFLENAPKLKMAIKIVQKDETFLELENVPKLKIAVRQELKKYVKKFYDDIPLNDREDKFIMQQFDELLKQYDLQDYKNEIVSSNSETNLFETLQAENEKLKAELDLIEKDKIATAEIIKRIGEKYF